MGFFNVVRAVAGALADEAMARQARVEREYNRKLNEYERKLDRYEKNHTDEIGKKKAQEARAKLNEARDNFNSGGRRTDADLEKDRTDINKKPEDFQCKKKIRLSDAIHEADTCTGVYIIYLNNSVMKCGRAAYGQGVRWRLVQYYNLNYDDRARKGDYWSISKENRDDVYVSWQCCPVSKCKELEYKLFKKYGKGQWAKRGPASCESDTWKLLI